jgi:hypothetical protein
MLETQFLQLLFPFGELRIEVYNGKVKKIDFTQTYKTNNGLEDRPGTSEQANAQPN